MFFYPEIETTTSCSILLDIKKITYGDTSNFLVEEFQNETDIEHRSIFLRNLEVNGLLFSQKSAQELNQVRQQFDSLRSEIAQSSPKFPTS